MESETESKSLIYLDCNATTPLAEEVITGISRSLITDWGNPSSVNPYGVKAKEEIKKARDHIANMLSCSPNEIIFTSGGTEANNMIIHSAYRYFLKTYCSGIKSEFLKAHIITTNIEHDSIIKPITYFINELDVNCSIVKVNRNGRVSVKNIISEITNETCLITVMYANNETGVIMPIPEIGLQISQINLERKKKNLPQIFFHTDAAQIIGKEKINFYESNVDFMTIVGHKFYGPKIGCICAREKVFPMFFGGKQENGVRPGTENTPMIVGLGIASRLVLSNIEKYKANMLECREQLEKKLKEVFGNKIVINCSESERLPNTCNISFREKGLNGSVVLSFCEKVVASVGAACHGQECSKILINSGVPEHLAENAIRLSVGRNTTVRDVEDAVSDLESAVRKVKYYFNIS